MFDFYYGKESEEFAFYQMPKVFYTDKRRFGRLSEGAKILYMFLLDRMKLSRKNGWLDEHNRVYIVYPYVEIEEDTGWGHNKVCDTMKELDKKTGIGLISRNRRGQGKVSVIYVHNFIDKELRQPDVSIKSEIPHGEQHTDADENIGKPLEVLKSNFQKFEKQTSRSLEKGNQEVCRTNPHISNNKLNNNDLSYNHSNQSVISAREKKNSQDVKDETQQYYIHSQQIGGRGLVSCLMKVMNMPFKDAVCEALNGEVGAGTYSHSNSRPTYTPAPKPEYKKPEFIKPEMNEDSRRVFAYLSRYGGT